LKRYLSLGYLEYFAFVSSTLRSSFRYSSSDNAAEFTLDGSCGTFVRSRAGGGASRTSHVCCKYIFHLVCIKHVEIVLYHIETLSEFLFVLT